MSSTQRLIAGRYRLVRPLAEGGFGRVWEAHDDRLRADVVVKEVRLPASADPVEQAKRLTYAEREARNAARLRHHPGIVPVYDVATEDGRPWIVMQLIEGSSLEERLCKGRLPVSETAELADALLKALDAAHQAGVVHRDVKPANVMLATDGRIMLTDFGIATHPADTRLTTDGSVVGSLEYMAPERLKGDPGTPAGDMFSLGATLYHAVEGISPFRRSSYPATMAAVVNEALPLPRHAERLAPLLHALLAKDPKARPTVTETLALLDSVRTGKNKRKTRKKQGPPPPPPTVADERPTSIFEESWTGDEHPGEFSEHEDRVGPLFVWMALLLIFGFVGLRSDGAPKHVLLGLSLLMMMGAVDEGDGYGARWLLRRRLRARTLRIDAAGITATDASGRQHIPWSAVAQVAVRRTDQTVCEHHLNALHIRLHNPKPKTPVVLYRPAGWPIQVALPDVCRGPEPPKREDWVPVCLLGPLPGPRRVDLQNAIAAHTGHSLETKGAW
ncbi:serine/threonine-protein kinase [Streptomyces sp. NPDC056002]|uniref:serine/threonine-protein kinase n=1 Tax=Streptomyces sp. NPDC056002 TaxID=3345675 RepID=UPI0035DC3841